MNIRDAVHSDPKTMGGTPVFVGTRVPVQPLFDYIEGGETLDEFLHQFPSVTRERLLLPLWGALAWTAVFLVVTTMQGIVRADFDPWHQAVSALSLGPAGWMQSLNLVLFGLVLMASARMWLRVLVGGVAATWYPALTVLSGISFVLAGLIPQDPAQGYDPAGLHLAAPTLPGLLHTLVAAIAALCSVGSLLVIATRFSEDPYWRWWPAYTRTIAVLMIGCIAIYAVWSVEPRGLAGTFERLAILLPATWACTFVWRLWQGTPFMVAPTNPLNELRSRDGLSSGLRVSLCSRMKGLAYSRTRCTWTLGGHGAEYQLRRLLQFSTLTSLNRAKSLTFAVTRTISFTNAIAAI